MAAFHNIHSPRVTTQTRNSSLLLKESFKLPVPRQLFQKRKRILHTQKVKGIQIYLPTFGLGTFGVVQMYGPLQLLVIHYMPNGIISKTGYSF